jgi:lysine decarboxylase
VALDGAALLDGTLATIRRLHAAVDAVPGCEVADFSAIEGVAAIDPLRTFVDVRGTGMSGHTVAGRVRDAFGINVELTTGAGFLLVHGFDEPPALTERCAEALRAVVADAGPLPPPADVRPPDTPPTPGERVLTPREAFLAPLRRVDAPDAVGEVSAELIAGYPPGIPTLVPGERITAAAIEHLASLFDGGVRLHGASDATLATVLVVDG